MSILFHLIFSQHRQPSACATRPHGQHINGLISSSVGSLSTHTFLKLIPITLQPGNGYCKFTGLERLRIHPEPLGATRVLPIYSEIHSTASIFRSLSDPMPPRHNGIICRGQEAESKCRVFTAISPAETPGNGAQYACDEAAEKDPVTRDGLRILQIRPRPFPSRTLLLIFEIIPTETTHPAAWTRFYVYSTHNFVNSLARMPHRRVKPMNGSDAARAMYDRVSTLTLFTRGSKI
jgi:hypothetical protein